ncbi:alpha/beta hydrolase family protein [Alicyclobacillus fodiniaquatilis]|uniref:Alpha/beta hydrolase family protein n=1 Tax=Alicyclobacillus fodiniaquatilis TaxID=1661150 RepID=A0ABW4JJJ0_9BACL
MAIGRVTKVLTDHGRAETFNDFAGCRTFPISIFYSINAEHIPHHQANFLSLFHPFEDEVSRIFSEMGISKEKLVNYPVSIVENANPVLPCNSCPVVIFSPAFGIERDLYMELITSIVESGYIVVTVGTPYESLFTVFPTDTIIRQAKQVSNQDFADFTGLKELVHIRMEDIKCVIDHLTLWNNEDRLLGNKFDLKRIGMIGHSLGGAAAFNAGTQDERVRCVVLLDASLHLLDYSDLDVPLLNMRQQAASLPELLADMREVIATAYIDGQRRLYDCVQSTKSFVKVIGSSHMSFSTFGRLVEQTSTDVTNTIQQVTVSFLKEFLSGEQGVYSELIHGGNRPPNLIEINNMGVAYSP